MAEAGVNERATDSTASAMPVLNWAGTRTLADGRNLLRPRTVAELREIVMAHRHVRPVGSRLTYEALTEVDRRDDAVDRPATDGIRFSGDGADAVLLDMSELSGLVRPMESAIRDPNFVDSENHDKHDTLFATFYAGTTIDALSRELERHGRYLDASPGVIGVQTVAGALATGTHGQGLHSAILPDTVVGMEIMVDVSVVGLRAS